MNVAHSQDTDDWEYLNAQALNEYEKGNYEKAEQVISKAIKAGEKDFGKKDYRYSVSLNNRAAILEMTGNVSLAEESYKEAIAIREALNASADVSLIPLWQNLGMLYEIQGKYKKAYEAYQKEASIIGELLGLATLEYANAQEKQGIALYHSGLYGHAEKKLLSALKIRREKLSAGHPDVKVSKNNLAVLYSSWGKIKDSERYRVDAGAEDIENADKTRLQSLENDAMMAYHLGNYHQAIELLTKIAERRKLLDGENNDKYLITLNNLAVIYDEAGQLEKAEKLYKEASILKKHVHGALHPEYAHSLQNLASFYMNIGYYPKAREYYTKALHILGRQKTQKQEDYPDILSNLAVLYEIEGDYSGAEKMIEDALRLQKEQAGTNNGTYASMLDNLGVILFKEGNYREAEKTYKEALEIRQALLGENHMDVAGSLNNLAVLYDELDRPADAEQYHLRSCFLYKRNLGDFHVDYAKALDNLAGFYENAGFYEEASTTYSQVLSIKDSILGNGHPSYAITLNHLAVLQAHQGDYKEAEKNYNKAAYIYELVLGKNHPDYVKIIHNLAECYEAIGNYEKAATYYGESIHSLENLMTTYFTNWTEKKRKQYYNEHASYIFDNYHSFVKKAYLSSNLADTVLIQAYENALVSKTLLLNGSIKLKERVFKSGDPDLIMLYNEWSGLRDQLAGIYLLPPEKIEEQNLAPVLLESRIAELETRLARSVTNKDKIHFNLPSWREVQGGLREGEAAVEIIRFHWYDKDFRDSVVYAAYVVTSESDRPEVVYFDKGNELEGKWSVFYQTSLKHFIPDHFSYENYWRKMEEHFPSVETYYISADGVYHQVNINTLYNKVSNSYIIDKTTINYVTTTLDLIEDKRNEVKSPKEALLFGRPVFAFSGLTGSQPIDDFNKGQRSLQSRLDLSSVEDLPGTEIEVKSIRDILFTSGYKSTIYLGTEASEKQLKSVKNPGILHIATHGFWLGHAEDESSDFTAMLYSGLLLYGESGKKWESREDDGILTAYEAQNLRLDQTELVVLSACQSGLGQIQYGEGVYGLRRAFRIAGARAIVTSLWNVDDQITVEFMQEFYRKWSEGVSKRKAFHDTQVEMKKKHANPYVWGAFILIGS